MIADAPYNGPKGSRYDELLFEDHIFEDDFDSILISADVRLAEGDIQSDVPSVCHRTIFPLNRSGETVGGG